MNRLLIFLLCSLATAKAVVIVSDIPDVGLFSSSGLRSFSIDLDGDGTDDIIIKSDVASMRISTLSDNVRVATFVTGGLDRGGNNLPFESGDIIGDSLSIGASWYQANDVNGNSNLLACRDIGCIGLWGGGINYAGIQITDDEGNERYGWIEIDSPFVRISGGILTRYAFETDANKAIQAIPEPSAAILSLLGVGLLARRSRR